MIQSAAYEIIKQEGIEEGIQQGIKQGIQQGEHTGELKRSRRYIRDILQKRFPQVATSLFEKLEPITSQEILDRLHIEAATAMNLEEFEAVMTQLLKESA